MSGFMGSKQTGVQTTTSAPPDYALPYLEKAMEGAEDIYENHPQTYYPGQTYTDFSPETMGAITAGEKRASASHRRTGLYIECDGWRVR